MIEETEKAYGIDFESLQMLLDGFIAQYEGDNTPAREPRVTLQDRIMSMVSAAVERAVAQQPARAETVSVTETQQQQRTIERTVTQHVALPAAPRHRLTPEQRQAIQMKRCSRCKQTKPFSEFADGRYNDGKAAWCLACDPRPGTDFSHLEQRQGRNFSTKEMIRHVLKVVGRPMRAREIEAAMIHVFVYSRPITCAKCHAPKVRYRMRRNSNLWICPECFAEIKASHIVLAADRFYKPTENMEHA